MYDVYIQEHIFAWMIYFHLFIMLGPLLVYMAQLELEDWQETHPKVPKVQRPMPGAFRPQHI